MMIDQFDCSKYDEAIAEMRRYADDREEQLRIVIRAIQALVVMRNRALWSQSQNVNSHPEGGC